MARDAICAAGDRVINASALDLTTERLAIETDILQIKHLLGQADNAIKQAVNDGDMTAEVAGKLTDLLQQNQPALTAADLSQAAPGLSQACGMFD